MPYSNCNAAFICTANINLACLGIRVCFTVCFLILPLFILVENT